MKKLDEFYYHEAIERAYLMCQINDLLFIHPVIKKHKKLKKRAKKISKLSVEIYQLVSGISHTKFQ